MTNSKLFPISLECKAYEAFLVEFHNKSTYIGQRLGQAFYDHFELRKTTNSLIKRQFEKLYQLDGKKAKAFIQELFEFN